jgi:hypothetical protein
MRGEIGEQRVEQIMRIAVAIEIDGDFAGFAFEQFRRRVVLLKIDEHGLPCIVIPDCAKRQVRNPKSPVAIMDTGFRAALGPGMTLDDHIMANSVLRRSVTSMAPG